MSEELPEELRRKLLRKWMSSVAKRPAEEKSGVKRDPEEIVWGALSDDKARELFRKARMLYPERYRAVIPALARAIEQGMIKDIDGYTALILLHRLGMPVRPDLRIKFVKHGKEVDFKEYMDG